MSREVHPKQMLTLFGARSMFQRSVDRLLPLLPPERIFVVTAAEQVAPLAEQMPELRRENFVVEPEGRGTAPCIGLAALHLRRYDPEAIMAVLTADHYIRREDKFREVLTAARAVAEEDYLVTLGIEPTSPSTGYGYIKRGEQLGELEGYPYYRVERFTEKPDAETAVEFLDAGTYAWNSGMFIWRAERILEEIGCHMPELDETLDVLDEALDGETYAETVRRIWPTVEKETIDYGIMERAEEVAMLPADIGWSDVGSWDAVKALHADAADAEGNVSLGEHIGVETRDTFVFSDTERLIATVGVEGLIIVDTPSATLITVPAKAEKVRDVVDRLRADEREEHL
jgi:mannose-1-phosphate guanylyltransferase